MRLSLQAKRVVSVVVSSLMIASSVPTQALASYADASNQLTGAAAAALDQTAQAPGDKSETTATSFDSEATVATLPSIPYGRDEQVPAAHAPTEQERVATPDAEADAAYQEALEAATRPAPVSDGPSYAPVTTLSDAGPQAATSAQPTLADRMALATSELEPLVPGTYEEAPEPLSPVQAEMSWALYRFGEADGEGAVPLAASRLVPRLGGQSLAEGVTLSVEAVSPAIFSFDLAVDDAARPAVPEGYDLRVGYDHERTSLDVTSVIFEAGAGSRVLVGQRAWRGGLSVAWADEGGGGSQRLRFSMDTGLSVAGGTAAEPGLTPAASSMGVLATLADASPMPSASDGGDAGPSLASALLAPMGVSLALTPQSAIPSPLSYGKKYIISMPAASPTLYMMSSDKRRDENQTYTRIGSANWLNNFTGDKSLAVWVTRKNTYSDQWVVGTPPFTALSSNYFLGWSGRGTKERVLYSSGDSPNQVCTSNYANNNSTAFDITPDGGGYYIRACQSSVNKYLAAIKFVDNGDIKISSSTAPGDLGRFLFTEVADITITYDGNGNTGGTVPSPLTFNNVQAVPTLSTDALTRAGYTHSGWNTAGDGSGIHYDKGATAPESSMTLYAEWTPNPYKVAYDANGGTGDPIPETDCTYDTAAKAANNSYTKTDCHFVGWNTQSDGEGTTYLEGADLLNLTDERDKTITLYAMWESNEFDITFDDQGGTGGQDKKTVTPSDTPESLGTVPIPTRANYTFEGYFTEDGGSGTRVINANGTWAAKPSAACVVYAKWDYAVSYQANDATGSTRATGSVADTAHVYAKGTPLSAGTGISRVGYNVDGWATEAGGAVAYELSQSVTDVADPKTLYAHWAPVTYKVVYDANQPTDASTTVSGSTAAATHTFDASENIDACGYELTGYTFRGWNTQADGKGTSYAPNTPVTNLIADPSHDGTSEFKLYARWEANAYTVTLSSADGTPASQTVAAVFDHPMPAITTPVREGYGFAGFVTGDDGTGTQYYGEGGVSTRNWDTAAPTTLYAKWGPCSYAVVFDANKPAGAQADNPVMGTTDTMRLYVDETKSLSENGYSLAGYTFLGWATDQAATTPDYQDKAEVKDLVQNPLSDGSSSITLYAVWQANSYAVTYVSNGGTLGGQEPAAVTCDAIVAVAGGGSNPTPPAGADWTFAGWQVARSGAGTDGVVGAVYQDESGAWLYRGGSCDVTLTARWLVSVPTPASGLSYVKDGTGAGVAQTLVAAGQGYKLLSTVPKDASDAPGSGLSDGSAFATHAGGYDVTASLDAADFIDMGAVRWAGESGAWDDADASDRTLSCTIDKATNSWVVEPAISSVVYGTDLTPVATADFQAATGEPVIQYAPAQEAGEGYAPSGDFSTDVPSEAGDYLMRATVAEADDYYGITSEGAHFEIARYEIPHPGSDVEHPAWAASVEAPDKVYTGEALLPASVAVTLPEPLSVRGRTELVRDTEFEVSYWFDEGLTQPATDAEGNSLMVDAGTYYVRVDGVGNFQGWSVGTFVVKPAETMTMGSPTSFVGTYDGQSHTVTPAEVEGVLARDTDSTQIMWSTSPDDVSSWTADPITFTDTTFGEDGVDTPHVVYLRAENPNYVTTPSVSGTVSIARKAVTVTPANVSKEFGTPDPELPCQVDGLVGGDVIDYTPVRTAGEDLGEYGISVDGSAVQGNYLVDYEKATFTIVARDIATARIDGLADRYVYAGSPVEPAFDVVLADGTRLVMGRDFNAVYDGANRIGTATVTAEGVGNYTGTLSADYVIYDDKVEARPVYRLYNPNSGEHFYTLTANERRALVAVGWTDEGIGWYAPDRRGDEVYRVYNPYTGDHHYTVSGFERDYLVNVGWRDEGVAWLSDPERRVPLYRDYNPNARVGSHNYTTDANEHRVLGTIGWRAEGVGWYGMPKQ